LLFLKLRKQLNWYYHRIEVEPTVDAPASRDRLRHLRQLAEQRKNNFCDSCGSSHQKMQRRPDCKKQSLSPLSQCAKRSDQMQRWLNISASATVSWQQ
jgi:hypothetical protein